MLHSVGASIAPSVINATANVFASRKFCPRWNPTNLGAPMLTSSIPTIATTRPVTSGGNSLRKGFITRESSVSKNPENIVMPHISGSPPAFPAKIDAEMYAGPGENGHK